MRERGGLLSRLSVNPAVRAGWRRDLTLHARRLGVPLQTLELLAATPRVARDFVRASRDGRGREFMDALDLVALERALAARELNVKPQSPRGLLGAQ